MFEESKGAATSLSPREVRQRNVMIAQISGRRFANQEVVIRNLSKRGLGAASQGLMPMLGENISVTLPGGLEVSGVVRWTDAPCFGMALDIELDPSAIVEARMKRRTPNPSPGWEVSRLHRVISPTPNPASLRRV